MAGAVRIRKGSKMRMALDYGNEQEPKFTFITTFAGFLDESSFLVSVPLKGGKPLEIEETQRLLFMYQQGDGGLFLAGYVDDEVVEGIHRYWKIRRVEERRQFFKRSDERMKVCLRIKYTQDTWPIRDGITERLDGMTMDISAGGAAVFLNHRFEVGETCKLFLPHIGNSEAGEAVEDVAGAVCWVREAPKGGLYRFITGVQYRFSNQTERNRMREYTGVVKKNYKV